jgi:hypothetical protein
MVGDWVYITEHPMRKETKQVKPEHFLRSLVTFEPIPLTPEILEKNGFYRREIPTRDEIGNYYHRKTAPSSIFVSMSFDDGRDFGNEIKYVHELQHALKLCKIDKEIVV